MRIACVEVPHFFVQAIVRADPELADAPLVVTQGNTLVDLSAAAVKLGLHPSMTLPQARAVAPEAKFQTRSPELETAAAAALGDVGAAFSPRVEAAPGRIFVDVSGLSRLWPSELELARAMGTMAERLGLRVRVGVAHDKITSRIASVVASEEEPTIVAYAAAFLAPLPVEALFAAVDAGEELVATLRRWGIRRIGELATLPSGGVALRLGAGGARLAQIARGEADDALVPRPEPVIFEEGLELEWPVDDLTALVFVLRRLIENLVARVTCRGLSASGLSVHLKLDRGRVDPTARAGSGIDVRTVTVAAPTRDLATLVELARLALERKPPEAPVTALAVQMTPSRARPAQLGFFEPAGPSPDKLATTLARLAALVGEDRVGAPQLPDSHLNIFTIGKFAPRKPNGNGPIPVNNADEMRALALHALRPPPNAEVQLDRGRPRYLTSTGIAGQVLAAAGPYRVRDGWWQSPLARDYYDIELSDGAVYRVFQDAQGWFVEGWYE
jgi:protein ImuB